MPSSFLMASAPISASNSSPYFSYAARYSSSVSSCFFFSGVLPGPVTT